MTVMAAVLVPGWSVAAGVFCLCVAAGGGVWAVYVRRPVPVRPVIVRSSLVRTVPATEPPLDWATFDGPEGTDA